MGSTINLTIKSDFKAASADLKKFGTLTESERKKIEKFQKSFKDENIKKFNDRLKRSTAAVKATRGPLAAMQHEHRKVRAEIEKLIRNGMDPLDDKLDDLTRSYKRLDNEMEDVAAQSKKNANAAKRHEGALLAVGAGAVVMGKQAVSAFIDFSRESAQAASDAEEIEGKFQVVFRGMESESTAASKQIAKDFDLASSTINKMLGDTGDLLTGFGLSTRTALDVSEATNRLALDLASFTNAQGGAEAVSKALTKAYANERDSLKTYGIVISQADVDARKLTDAQKGLTFENDKAAIAYATLALATEQSKNAIGDYARTSESAANVQKTLDEQIKRSKENWGSFINQALTPARKALRDFLDAANDASEEYKNLNDAVSGKGGADIAAAIEAQAKAVANAKEGYEILTKRANGHSEVSRRGLDIQEALLETLKRQQSAQQRGMAAKENALKLTEAEATAAQDLAKAEEEQASKSIEALEEIEKLRVSSLSAEEKQLENIQSQINEWSKFRNVAGAQELINQLVEERNTLLETSAQKVKDLADQEAERAEKEAKNIQDELDLRIEHEENLKELHRAREQGIAESKEAEKEAEALAMEEKKEALLAWVDFALEATQTLGSGIDNLQKAFAQKETKRLDKKMKAELKRKGLLEKTEKERIQEELKAAFAAGDLELIKEKQDALERATIEEKFQKKKAEVEYKAALASWGISLVTATASGAQAVLAALASAPPPFNIALAALSGAAAGLQIGTIAASKPSAPSFQTGTGLSDFVVPENTSSSKADSSSFNASPGEKINVTPRGEEDGGSQNISFGLDGEVFVSFINEKIESGDIHISLDNLQQSAATA